MAIHLEANYSKKLGLPGYRSHQYSVTIKTEVTDPNQVPAESSRLYDMLQSCVDREIQKTGFLPQGNDRGNGGTGAFANNNNGAGSCNPKQRDLILDIVDRNHGPHASRVRHSPAFELTPRWAIPSAKALTP